VNPSDRLQLDFELPILPYAREIVRSAWRVYVANFFVLALITIAVMFPMELVSGSIMAALPPDPQSTQTAVIAVVLTLIGLGMQSLLIPVAVHSVIERMRTGTNPPLAESFHFGLHLWARTVWIRTVTAIGIAIGFVLLFIPGMLLWYRWLFTEVIVAVEERSETMEILRRGSELSEGDRMDMFVAMLLAGIPFSVFGWVINKVVQAGAHWAIVGGHEWRVVCRGTILSVPDLDGVPRSSAARVFDERDERYSWRLG
jgi:hypothetical protein